MTTHGETHYFAHNDYTSKNEAFARKAARRSSAGWKASHSIPVRAAALASISPGQIHGGLQHRVNLRREGRLKPLRAPPSPDSIRGGCDG